MANYVVGQIRVWLGRRRMFGENQPFIHQNGDLVAVVTFTYVQVFYLKIQIFTMV